MAKIKLTNCELHAEIDDEDFSRVNQYNWQYVKNNKKDTYYQVCTTIKKKRIRLHRFILGLNNPKIVVDHIDRDTLNNKKDNLRATTQTFNRINSEKRYNKTGYVGVTKTKYNTFRSQAFFENKTYDLGTFLNPEDAALARDKKVVELYGSTGVSLNFELAFVLSSELPKKVEQGYQSRGVEKPDTRKVDRPDPISLHRIVWSKPLKTYGKELGITDNAIRKWCKFYKVPLPNRGFWQKVEHNKLDGLYCPTPDD